QVIMAAITWIGSLFTPVGALIKLVMTIWNLYTFVRDQLSRIVAIARSVVEGLANIAQGIIEPAADKVEEALADLVPVAIDLLAKLLNLNGVAAKVREILGSIRNRIDLAVTHLIEKVLTGFRGGAEAQVAEAGPAETVPGEHIGDVLAIDAAGEPHHALS